MNKQTDPNIKTIRFPVTADSKLQKMTEKCGLTKIEFFVAMVDYFYKSKKDPRDLNDELLKRELVLRSDRIIGFIRTMESELLFPLKKDGEKLNKSQKQIVDFFNEHIIQYNKGQREAFSKQEVLLNAVNTAIQSIQKAQIQRQSLKNKFSHVLEYYIKARDNMGITTKQIDKDNLANNVRQQLENL